MRPSNRTANSKDPKLRLLEGLIRECFTVNTTHSEVEANKEPSKDGLYCPRTFDGFACWDETPADATAYQPCPDFVIGFDPRRYAYKRCLENGTWFLHPEGNKPWTNYTTCIDVEDLNFRSVVNNIYVVGYVISVAALLISVAIFLYFRSLQCTRIRIHIHLFTSFALNNLLWIVWYKTVIDQVTVVQNNRVWCQVLHVITNYFMVTSYIWMFCEGLHLHIALVVVFVKDEVAMRWFVATGWGLPMLIVGVYSAVRYNTPGATERCWMEISDCFWIIIVPVLISLFASFDTPVRSPFRPDTACAPTELPGREGVPGHLGSSDQLTGIVRSCAILLHEPRGGDRAEGCHVAPAQEE
ncbi:calcitonin receptor-like isoform X5 [Ostrinia nubilalis]|uniref:calcitonin receptor-like isoform X5 n=1 Tax=Ostrinia nubilalis TaxID=29057 RepID=UPI00308246FD